MDLGHDEIRAELERVLSAESFKRSERLSCFLRFVVENALQGKDDQLKEYVLGAHVYQKGVDFDARIDSTVRVEAGRLRAKLREYYDTQGREHPIRIELPKGGYAPHFRRVEATVPRVGRSLTSRFWWAGFLLAVAAVLLLLTFPRSKQPIATGVRPLTTWPGQEIHPCYSPDGKQIAMVWSGDNDDNRDIYVRVGESRRLRLTSHPEPDRSPAWSPDGLKIAFARDSPTGVELYVVPAVGGAERLIAKLRRRGLRPSAPVSRSLDWFPDGVALLVADENSGGKTTSLFRVSVETGEQRQLTSPPPHSPGDSQPAVSPDGRLIAFTRSCPACDIYVMPATGGESRRLTFEEQVISGFAWTADGRSIVLSSERGATAGAGSLWKVAVGHSASPARLEQIPGIGPRASHPAIARHGRQLAYQESFQDTNIWRTPVSGRGTPELLISSTREETLPDYSPDGGKILFSSNRSGYREIWIANTDGSNARQLTSFAGAPAMDPRWSPDGRLIAFAYTGQGNGDIYTMTPEGDFVRRLTSDPSRDEAPSFSSDGRWIYFSSNRSGVFEVWKLAVDDPVRVVQVTHAGGTRPIESPDGKYLYFRRAADVWRLQVNSGDETRVLGPLDTASWIPDRTGIYFIEGIGRIAFYSFATRRTTTVIPLRQASLVAIAGLALSPDGLWLAYGQKDRAGSDIMLVEGFQ
jgi:Tol biopolymer transport system component